MNNKSKQELDNFMNDFPAEMTDKNILLFLSVCPLGETPRRSMTITYVTLRMLGNNERTSFEKVMEAFIEAKNKVEAMSHAKDN